MALLPGLPSKTPAPQNNGPNLASTGDVSGDRWNWAPANEVLWNKSFPYQLAVVKAMRSDVNSELGGATTYSVYKGLIFTLPINPESMTLGMPFAITPMATLGGVVEQHGGVPFRQIQFSGTFGVVADRPSATTVNPGSLGVVGGIFAGTLNAAQGVTSVASALGIGPRFTSNRSASTPSTAEGDIAPGSTGYFQFLAFQKFLETYAEMKKTAAGRDLRLVLYIWKEQSAYICTPLSFDVQRAAARPFEYMYSLRLQAWSRVDPLSIVGNWGMLSSSMRSNLTASKGALGSTFAQTLTYISNAIRLVKQVQNVVKGVRSDFDKVVGTLRQVALFVSSVGGLVKTAMVLPKALRTTLTSTTIESWDIIKGSFDGKSTSLAAQVALVDAEVKAVRSGQATTSPALAAILADDNSSDFHELVQVDNLNLSQTTRNRLDNFVAQTLLLTSADFRRISDQMLDFAASYSDAVGLSDSTYDLVFQHTRAPQVRLSNDDDLRNMHSLVSAANAVGDLVMKTPNRTVPTTIEYIAGLANANGIAMRVPNSKFAVPFPYGGTLERLALQYLGDASRWMEIAELNDLRAPYVDEAGTSEALSTNGSGNIITLTDASELLLGQQVHIWSDTVITEKRNVVAIRKVGLTQWEVTLDGAADLAKLKTANAASVQWFAAATVNSGQVIYIPSDGAADLDIIRYVPNLTDFDRILDIGDVDGMLTNTGDLVVTPDGDWPIVFGYAYLVQWARVALNTKVNSLSLHPDFGVDVGLGDSIADSSAQDILDSVKNVFKFNSTFTGVNAALITRQGPVTSVALELGVRGSDALLPITFSVTQ